MDISKHFKGGKAVGWKKFIMGRNFHLVTGTSVADYQFAVRFATALAARADLLKLQGGQWSDAVIFECRELARGPVPPVPQAVVTEPAAPRPAISSISLYSAMELFKEAERQRGDSKLIVDQTAKDSVDTIERSKRG